MGGGAHTNTYTETMVTQKIHTPAQMHTHKHAQILFIIKKEVNSDPHYNVDNP